MKIFQTKISIYDAAYPTVLDQLRILNKRKIDFLESERYRLVRLEAGEVGEETIIQYLKEYGHDHWVVLQNIWLSEYGTCECDIILITNDCIYVIEVKNYTGTFIYEDGSCNINGRSIKNNCVAQARKAFLNVRDLIQKYSYNIKVKGVLIFSGIDNMVDIKSPVEDVQVVLRCQLRHFIQNVAEHEAVNAHRPINKEKIIEHLEKYQVSNPYLPNSLTLSEMKGIKSGIYCARCGNFNIKMGRAQYIKCSCGFYEPRERAIVRTICEYGVLRYGEKLKQENLLPFFNYEITRRKLREVLYAHFETVHKNRYTYQINKQLPIEKNENEFEFSLPNKLIAPPTEYIWY